MLLLHELGEARRIPARAVASDGRRRSTRCRCTSSRSIPATPRRAPICIATCSCHCALGSIDQVLAACGVDVDRALPWIAAVVRALPDGRRRPQLRRRRLPCDRRVPELDGRHRRAVRGDAARRRRGPASSARSSTARRGFLIERQLMRGSPTVHNAEERDAAPAWRALFPALLLLRRAARARRAGALGRGERARCRSPRSRASSPHLVARFPDGVVRLGRRAYAGRTTIVPTARSRAQPRQPASTFPLLEAASVIGEPERGADPAVVGGAAGPLAHDRPAAPRRVGTRSITGRAGAAPRADRARPGPPRRGGAARAAASTGRPAAR